MRISKWNIIILLGLILSLTVTVNSQEERFSFLPLLNNKYEVVKITLYEEFMPEADTVRVSISTTTQFEAKAVEGLIEIKSTMQSYAQAENGLPANNPVLQAYVSVPLVYRFNLRGEAINAFGFGEVKAKLNKAMYGTDLTPEVVDLAIEEAKQGSLDDINERNSALVGREIRVGDRFFLGSEVNLFTGLTAPLFSVITINLVDTVNDQTVVELRAKGSSNPYLLAAETVNSFDPIEEFHLDDSFSEEILAEDSLIVERTALSRIEAATMRTVYEKRETFVKKKGGDPSVLLVKQVEESQTEKNGP